MAGPRAPIGTLSQHAATAAGLVRNMVPRVFGARTGGAKQTRKSDERVESESDSDSDSSTNSDTEAETDEATREDTKVWADRVKASRAASVPAAAHLTSPKAKVASPQIKKQESESSASESESESGSDDEGDKMDVDPTSDPKAGSKTAKTGNTKAEEDTSDSESATSDDEEAAPVAKVAANAEPAAEESATSDEESAAESQSEDESEDEDEQKPAAKAKTQAQSESESEESEESDESEEEPEAPQKPKEKASTKTSAAAKETPKAKNTAPAKPSKATAAVTGNARSKEFVSDQSSSEAESESEEESGEPMAVDKPDGKTVVQPPREIISRGFYMRKAEENVDAAVVARVFKKAKAEGKQIWYFTTPKSVPIEVIQENAIPLDKVHAGSSIFTHEGAEYTGHFEESVSHAIKVLIPAKTGSNYETLNQSVDRVLHITRAMRFDAESEAAPAAPSASVSKAPRPQPKGLRARYQPFGVTNGPAGNVGLDTSDNEDDVEMIQAPPLADSAAGAKSDTPKKVAKKRKHGDVEKGTPNGQEAASAPVKKSKKARVDSATPKAVESSSGKQPATAEPSNPAESTPVKKSKKDKSKKKDPASAVKATPVKVTPVLPPAVPNMKST